MPAHSLRTENFLTSNIPGIILAVLLHVAVFQYFIFIFPVHQSRPSVEITFLGSILGPIETGKVKQQSSVARGETLLIDLAQRGHKEFISPQKPDMSRQMKARKKTTQKTLLLPEAEPEARRAASSAASLTEQPLPEYQPLRLYSR